MNNNTTTTKNLATVAAILIAVTLVVGMLAATSLSTTTGQSAAFAYSKKKGGQDKGGNGNTNTPQEINAESNAVGFDATTESELQNQICTHPNNNAACSEEEVVTSAAITTAAGNNTVPVKLSCEQCFTSLLTQAQISSVISQLHTLPQFSELNTLADLCALLKVNAIGDGVFLDALSNAGVSGTTINELLKCLFQVGIVFE